jgi:exopolyphosphatase / guanosine-5'-triphosphate,3'-diphosphate pyrophosphatase
MTPQQTTSDMHTVAFMDIGTNSIRLLVVRIHPNHSYTILTQLKQMVRLGEGEFTEQLLQPAAIDRAVLVSQQFAALARTYGVDDIIAVATAATREAVNQRTFIRRLRQEAELDVRVVSGLEEARLTYLGVASGIHLDTKQALFIDIGGGSTEVIIGTQHEYRYLNSLKLGAIRLAASFLTEMLGPVSPDTYAQMQRQVLHNMVHTFRELRAYRLDLAVGSSGTIENLADVAARLCLNRPRERDDVLTHAHLQRVISTLRALPLEERREVPGLNPARADIIIAGAAILDTLMQELSMQEIRLTDRGLRDGLLVDYLLKNGHTPLLEDMSVRRRSVLRLGRACHFHEDHAQTTARLALALFDSARQAKLHRLGAWERELLEYAALLHHIGSFLTYNNYQAHTYYLIRNAELLGFDQMEVTIIAATALYHRKTLPRKKHPEFAALNKRARHIVRILCVLLRLAENLDRSQTGHVQHAFFDAVDESRVVLSVHAEQDCHIEIWGVQQHIADFEKIFHRHLELNVVAPVAALSPAYNGQSHASLMSKP